MTSPVADFCADLRRRWRLSGRDLPGVARDLRISRTQLYAILNGEIKRPPDWDGLVRPLVEACGGTGELAEWRQRHEVLTRVHEELGRRRVTGPPPPAQLPAEVAGFTARQAELATLDATAPGATVIVSGLPGVGKTALAVAWGHRAAGRFPDGRLYADLRGGTDGTGPDDVIRQFLDAFGLPPGRIPETPDAQRALWRTMVADRRMLVVLDNAHDADQVRPLLPGGGSVTTVVTSRRPLTALVAETGARPVVVRPLAEPEAVELLLRRVDPRLRDDDAARSIAAACGGLPLALALAAARAGVTGFGLDALADELRRSGSRLNALEGGALRPVFAWSADRLSPAAARLFRLLGSVAVADIASGSAAVLDGRTPPETAASLRELTEAGLLTERAPGRFAMHDLIRIYAAEAAGADREEALVRLLDHYTHQAYRADRVLNPTRAPIPVAFDEPPPGPRLDVPAARGWLETEREALLDALRQAKDEGLDRHAWQLGWALATFLNEQRRWHDEGAAWAAALSAATAMTDRDAAAHAHCFLAVVDARMHRFTEARDHMRHALDLNRASGDRFAEAEHRFTLSYVCWLLGERDAALTEITAALQLFHELDSTVWEAKTARATAWYHGELGDRREALALYERALTLSQHDGDLENEAITRSWLGLLLQGSGDRTGAATHFLAGLGHARTLGDDALRAEFLIRLGDLEESRDRWEEAYLILSELGDPQAAEVRARLDGA